MKRFHFSGSVEYDFTTYIDAETEAEAASQLQQDLENGGNGANLRHQSNDVYDVDEEEGVFEE